MTLSSTIAEVLLGENDLRRQVVQIARRLRAMLENLIATLPAHRHPAC